MHDQYWIILGLKSIIIKHFMNKIQSGYQSDDLGLDYDEHLGLPSCSGETHFNNHPQKRGQSKYNNHFIVCRAERRKLKQGQGMKVSRNIKSFF